MPSQERLVEVYVDDDGNLVINAKGFTGRDCLKATRPFEEALGVIEQRTMKPEIHAVQRQEVSRFGQRTTKQR